MDAGIVWLLGCRDRARHRWSCLTGPDEGLADYHAGATSLALLVLLRAEYDRYSPQTKDLIKSSLSYLGELQEKGKPKPGDEAPYEHAFAIMTMVEAYQQTLTAVYRDRAKIGVRASFSWQDVQGGGWKYAPRQAGDLSVTAWHLQALEAAKAQAIETKGIQQSFDLAKKFLNNVQKGPFEYAYEREQAATTSMTAAGNYCRLLIGQEEAEEAHIQAAGVHLTNLGVSANPYENYYTTKLLKRFQHALWPASREKITAKLLAEQEQTDSVYGSWRPNRDVPIGKAGGRLVQTTFNLLILLECQE